MPNLPVPSPVELWELSVVRPWQGDKLLQFASSRRGGVDEYGCNGTPVKCGGEDAAFQTSRDPGEIREVKFLNILE